MTNQSEGVEVSEGLKTRQPSGKPSWPVLLIAGGEKAGKSWACAEASASDKVGRTIWVSVGETDPDAYGAIPGANFEIAEHSNTLQSVKEVLEQIVALPKGDKPTLLVVDSMTRLWEMVTDKAQDEANKKPRRDGGESIITMDLWNRAKGFWGRMVQTILSHDGPVLLTARLEAVTVMDNGKPTPLKADKIKTEKNLPYDVDGVIEMPTRGEVFISGIRSVSLQVPERRPFPDFTVEGLWDSLGLADVSPRRVSAQSPADPAEAAERVEQAAVAAHEAEMGQS